MIVSVTLVSKAMRVSRAVAVGLAVLPGIALAQAGTQSVPFGGLVVPKNITYWEMFANATLIVKIVMIMLLAASLISWTIWLAKLGELKGASRKLRADQVTLDGASKLESLGALKHPAPLGLVQAARAEFSRTGSLTSVQAGEGLKERIAARFQVVEANAIERVLSGASVLATIGSIAPFVGLFGTVWGIMNSFIGISQSNTTNLAVVAPGIAEALLATAMGLVAAIPAVIMYNHVARLVAGYRRRLAETATQVACLVSHEVDVQLARSGSPARAAA